MKRFPEWRITINPFLSLRLSQIDRKIFQEEHFTVIDNAQTIAWQNALTRCLRALGVPEKPRDADPQEDAIDQIMAEMERGDAAG